MATLTDLIAFLEAFAPPGLAESWDNVGLLVGDPARPVARVMTCLTITPASAREAIDQHTDAIITHHPLPFRPLNRLTSHADEGRLLLDLIAAGVAIYSPHTAFDSAPQGINQQLALGLGLSDVCPLVPAPAGWLPQPGAAGADDVGGGRQGRWPQPRSLRELADAVKGFLRIGQVQVVGSLDQAVDRVAVA
jgi:dinuclear metal center YbgI/SA1388 family protein